MDYIILPKWASAICVGQDKYTTRLQDDTQMNVSCMENEAPLARTGTRQLAEAHNEEIFPDPIIYTVYPCFPMAFDISAHDSLILMSPFHLQGRVRFIVSKLQLC